MAGNVDTSRTAIVLTPHRSNRSSSRDPTHLTSAPFNHKQSMSDSSSSFSITSLPALPSSRLTVALIAPSGISSSCTDWLQFHFASTSRFCCMVPHGNTGPKRWFVLTAVISSFPSRSRHALFNHYDSIEFSSMSWWAFQSMIALTSPTTILSIQGGVFGVTSTEMGKEGARSVKARKALDLPYNRLAIKSITWDIITWIVHVVLRALTTPVAGRMRCH